MGVVSRIRGQDFLLPVQPSLFNRQKLGLEMLELMRSEYTDEELELMDKSYKVFGLVPPEVDTAKLMAQMLTEEVAGFYDPDNKRMVLVVEDGPQKEPGWLGRLLGAKPTFDKDEQKTTLAHELTHALQDQLYDLNAMEAGIEDDDDMLMAFSALVEGDATLLMFAEAGENQDIADMDPEAMRATFNIMSWMMPVAGGATFRSAPPIFRDSLMFPYFQGMLFTLNLAKDGGWENVHRAYGNPPLSTEQILHPTKYLGDVDLPQKVSLPELAHVLDGSPWKQMGGNCLGELQTGTMLRKVARGKQATLGWDGDRYEVYKSDVGTLALIYVSLWDSEKDAQEFAEAYRSYRQPLADPTAEVVETAVEAVDAPAVVRTPDIESPARVESAATAEVVRVVEVHGDKVWVVEGFSRELSDAIVGELGACRFEEKRFPTPAAVIASDQ